MKKIDNHISCPKCGWLPDGKSHWQCRCGHSFDAFEHAGRCPACFRQWEKTQCVPQAGGCSQSTPHLDWYGDLKGWLEKELYTIEVPQSKEKRP